MNPIRIMVITIGVRFFLSLVYVSVASITNMSDNFGTWLGVFVLGVVPDFPLVVNVILFFLVNGNLILYLALMIKRLLNPVAN